MSKIIVVGGTPGAGKSTIVHSLGNGYRIINMGTEMLNAAKRKGHKIKRDDIRYLSADEQIALRATVIKEINRMKGSSVIDTHLSVRNKNNMYLPGITAKNVRGLKNLAAIIYIDSTPEEIIERRRKDHTRKREEDAIDDIVEQREFNMSLMAVYSVIFSIPIYMVKNQEGRLEKTVKQVKSLINEIFR